MADTEETPSQRQARLRREKREAKIKAGGTERLDKITRLSGRTPENMRNESPTPVMPPTPPSQPASPSPNLASAASPAQVQAQEEYLRQLLRAPPPGQPGQGQGQGQPAAAGQNEEFQDPMMKMMQQMLGGLGGDPSAGGEGGLPFSPDDLAKATGLPPFVTDMFMGKQKTPPTPAQQKTAQMWTVIHILFALLAGTYVVRVLSRSLDTFGEKAPAPPTFQNPFLVFITGELLVQGGKMVTAGPGGKQGLWLGLQVLKDMARDGCLVVFAMGAASWWRGLA